MEEVIRSDLPDAVEKKRPKWVKWCILAVCLVLVIAAILLLLRGSQPKRYFFDKEKYPVIGTWMDDIAGPVPSPTDWESMCSVASEYNDTCIIAECTVGGSYNDVERDSFLSGQALTSIRIDKIHKIYSPDSTVTIKEGQSAYVIEPYCYVDDSTPTLKERCQGKEGIFTLSSYSPLVAGKYIMFLCSDDDYYQYTNVSAAENALFLRPFPAIGGAYQIADAEEVEKNRIEVSSYFWEFWTDVMETYAGYTIDTPTAMTP